MGAPQAGRGMQGGPCPEYRAAIGFGSRGGNCGHGRLGRLPEKMAVGLAAPLSLLQEERAAGGNRPPNSAACPRRGTAAGPRGLGARASPGLYKKVEAGSGGGGRCGGAARSPPTPCPAASPPRASPAGSPRAGSRTQAATSAPRVKERFSFLTWCRAEAGEQWRRDTPLPPPPPRARPGRAKGAERRRRGAR